ncbi:acyl-CoA dehydrogenase family protein [Salinarimonas ramus]|uniref:Acyl-CoA dehydrogenase n=1 Tax=Salinarimonas ramus TaxID=690164 RepID=A0A917QAF4_9HYPH|nr:acyl-CoA dehydrogenase family protein [Salinarimonas ramus]GGK39434.1 hypothetical protein GCM10011322_28200 [Salinarimonas ramus]
MHPPELVSRSRAIASEAAGRAADLDRDDAFPMQAVAALARAELLGAPVPCAAGGAGLGCEPAGARPLLEILRILGTGSLPLARVYEGHVNALRLVARYGTDEQRERLFAEARGGTLFGVWNTDARERPLALVEGSRGLSLTGAKAFCSGAGHVARPLVTARAAHGRVMLVPRLEPGERVDLSDWRAHGMRASATGNVAFDGVRVAAQDVLGEPGDYERQPLFSGGAWRFCAAQLGGIEAVLDAMREHLRACERDGDPHQRARIGQAAIAAETARLWVERACDLAEGLVPEAADPERVVAYVDLARCAVERAGLDVVELAQRSVGLAGFMRTHPLERLVRDLSTYLRQPAPDRALVSGGAHVAGSGRPSGEVWRDPEGAP